MYLWDKLKYKVNYVRFISNENNQQQVWLASAVVNKLEEPVYDHRTRIRERSRSLWKCNDNQPISVFWEIGGTKAHCLIDSRCEGMMISPNFIRVAKIELFLRKHDHKVWRERIERIFWYYQHRLLWCNLRNSFPKKAWSDNRLCKQLSKNKRQNHLQPGKRV